MGSRVLFQRRVDVAEVVVDANRDSVSREVAIKSGIDERGEILVEITEIEVPVFNLRAPGRSELILDTAAEGPSTDPIAADRAAEGAHDATGISAERAAAIEVGPAAFDVEEGGTPGIAQTARHIG